MYLTGKNDNVIHYHGKNKMKKSVSSNKETEEEKEFKAQKELFKIFKDKDLIEFSPEITEVERILDELDEERSI